MKAPSTSCHSYSCTKCKGKIVFPFFVFLSTRNPAAAQNISFFVFDGNLKENRTFHFDTEISILHSHFRTVVLSEIYSTACWSNECFIFTFSRDELRALIQCSVDRFASRAVI